MLHFPIVCCLFRILFCTEIDGLDVKETGILVCLCGFELLLIYENDGWEANDGLRTDVEKGKVDEAVAALNMNLLKMVHCQL